MSESEAERSERDFESGGVRDGLTEHDPRLHSILLAGVGHAVIAVDPEARIFYWNRAAEDLYGWRAEEVLGRSVLEVTVPSLSEREAETILARLRAGEGWSGEFLVRRKDGSVFTALVTDRPVFDEQGEMAAIVGVNVDVSDRVRTEEALRESEARYRSVLELLPESVVVYAEGKILYANRAAARLVNLPGGDGLVGREIMDLLHPSQAEQLRDRMVEAQAGGAVRRGVVEEIRMPDGRARVLEISSAPINYGGEPARQAVVRDITERVRMEEELRRLAFHLDAIREEEQSRLAREIHDELGQILTGLKLDVAWLERRLQADPEAYPTREELVDRATELRRQVEEAMDSVRHVSSELRPTVLDDLGLEAGLEWLVAQFSRRFDGVCEARMRIPSAEDAPLGDSCSTALFRILQEALTNVLRHASASRVSIRAERVDGWLELAVEDDGVGFQPDAPRPDGSAGLLVMRERARGCGGRLDLRCEPGGGVTVTARIPLSVAEADTPS